MGAVGCSAKDVLPCAAQGFDDACGDVKHQSVDAMEPLFPVKAATGSQIAALNAAKISTLAEAEEPQLFATISQADDAAAFDNTDVASPMTGATHAASNDVPCKCTEACPFTDKEHDTNKLLVADKSTTIQHEVRSGRTKILTKVAPRQPQKVKKPSKTSEKKATAKLKLEVNPTSIKDDAKTKKHTGGSIDKKTDDAKTKKHVSSISSIATSSTPADDMLHEVEEARLLSLAEGEDAQWQVEMGMHSQKAGLGSSLRSWMSRTAHAQSQAATLDPEKPLSAGARHFVKKTPLFPPWPTGFELAMFGMGCFWCAESIFMEVRGVFSTQVGFAGGKMIKPTYDAVSLDASFAKTGETGKIDHAEVVRVVFDPREISYERLLKLFWEKHNPTMGNKQGRDEGYQYRSFIGCYGSAQKAAAGLTLESFQFSLRQRGIDRKITTEIRCPAPHFWYAEEVHQQYDAKPFARPYCGLSPTGARLT